MTGEWKEMLIHRTKLEHESRGRKLTAKTKAVSEITHSHKLSSVGDINYIITDTEYNAPNQCQLVGFQNKVHMRIICAKSICFPTLKTASPGNFIHKKSSFFQSSQGVVLYMSLRCRERWFSSGCVMLVVAAWEQDSLKTLIKTSRTTWKNI